MKQHIILTILLVSFCKSVSATLPARANLSIDPGSTFGMEVNAGFWVDISITGFNGLNVGFAQRAYDSHGGLPDGTESPSIDNPWEFFNSTGMHQTTSAVTIISDNGAGNVSLDFSGWGVTWSSIPDINMGSGPDAGVATMTCAIDCSIGDSYTLTYQATVPEDSTSGFAGVQYRLNLNGAITGENPPPSLLSNLASLQFDPGVIVNSGDACISGSCFGMEVVADHWIWTPVIAGTDGGIVTGKEQLSGGQQYNGSSAVNSTPGDMTEAWYFFGAFGTFHADNSLNVFSANSDDGISALNDFNVAWNGYSVPMGGGRFEEYNISLATNPGAYSFRYAATVPEGHPSGFGGANFVLIARGDVYVPDTCTYCNLIVNDISIFAESGFIEFWTPSYTDSDPGGNYSCHLITNASNGNATVAADCSSGTYTSGAGFTGTDSFTYSVTNQYGISATGTVNVNVVYGDPCLFDPNCLCKQSNPLKQVVSTGGGQSSAVNDTLQTTFIGHIVTETGLTSGAKNTVKICPGTTVDFSVTSSTGTARCTNKNIVTATTGSLGVGDKLVCTNKPDGSDTDKFVIKEGF